MKLGNHLFKTIKPAFVRFPAVYVLFVALAAVSCISTGNLLNNDISKKVFFALCWASITALSVQLAAEKFLPQRAKTRVILQCASTLTAIPAALLLQSTPRASIIIVSLLIAMVALLPFWLSFTQDKNNIALNIFVSAFASSVLMACVCCAIEIIYLASATLFLGGDHGDIIEYIWICSYFIVFLCSFTAFCTRRNEHIVIPSFCKVVFLYTLLPLYAVLLLILYLYLIKSIVTLSIPMREANIFISFATALFILFEFTLPRYDCKATELFHRYTPFALIPLIIVQIVISADRIHAHGISSARYAVLLYILFSAAAIFLSRYKNGEKMLLLCPIFAFLSLFASISSLNIISVPLKSQTRIMENVLNAHNLLQNGEVNAAECAKILSADEREILTRAYGKIEDFSTRPSWFKEDFANTFGFNAGETAAKTDYYYWINVPSSKSLDVRSFTEIYRLRQSDDNMITFANETIDIRAHLLPLLRVYDSYDKSTDDENPLVIHTDSGFTLILTQLKAYAKNIVDGTPISADDLDLRSAAGYAAR